MSNWENNVRFQKGNEVEVWPQISMILSILLPIILNGKNAVVRVFSCFKCLLYG